MRKLLYLLLCASSVFAARPGFFPLAAGNRWIYRSADFAQQLAIEVDQPQTIQGRKYFIVRGYSPRELLVREDERGNLFEFDQLTNQDRVLTRFDSASYETNIAECPQSAQALSEKVTYDGTAGVFQGAAMVRYRIRCGDAGISEEQYIPGIGLGKRVLNTIAGPRHLDLVYARVEEFTLNTGPEVAVTVKLDRTVYYKNQMPGPAALPAPFRLTATLTLNTRDVAPVDLEFASSMPFDLQIKDAAGRVVVQPTQGQFFAQAIRKHTLSDSELSFVIVIDLANPQIGVFQDGRYTLEAWLNTTEQKRYSGTVGFEIRTVQ